MSLISSTCKHDTAKTEFVLRKADGRAHVQVKQGQVPLNRSDYTTMDQDPNDPCEWYLFTTHGRYTGTGDRHVHCLDPRDMRDFALSHRKLMSSRVQGYMDFLETLG